MNDFNDFSRQDIESLKASVDLADLMRSYGIELKPVGRNFAALCPWHDDKDASLVVNPAKQLYNCFGCDAKGDVLTFLQAQEELSFPQAVMKLREFSGEAGSLAEEPAAKPSDPDRFEGGHTRNSLLEKVCQHYQLGLEGSDVAREYLQGRKLWDSEVYGDFAASRSPETRHVDRSKRTKSITCFAGSRSLVSDEVDQPTLNQVDPRHAHRRWQIGTSEREVPICLQRDYQCVSFEKYYV